LCSTCTTEQFLHGNLGTLQRRRRAVLVAGQQPGISASAIFLAVVIAIPLGIFQAVGATPSVFVATTLAFVTYAMPFFYIFAIQVLRSTSDLRLAPASTPR
jgi:ABC-type dipeptide/oligopeptide/nickel transport system permease component